MSDAEASGLPELADLVFAVGRQLRPPTDPEFEPCTPIEISVMRFVHRNPGTSARAASEATLLPSSNFSRVLRGLEKRDLVDRVVDERSARGVRLYPTEKARRNLGYLHDNWEQTLRGIVDDPAAIEIVNATLRRIEDELIARRRGPDHKGDRSA
ncbi:MULTISPECIES: MarR family winged helix-turn-helix transcriptional regulator [Streptomyces]|uniref:Transcriptional regulator, MarR family n=1 Tax=Streptomyces albus (strain ATCC 21838 / DSM 41398 / FERM P-419 / JCM 4703 / NBRC 107858) TaxID=1081613 RepID=A0A0B5ETR1_STRA4|nr:MarR family winged helix-turn-helix transcriptional regulator [Streptomyces sp. SCSIO ZS0520]AJE81497.1 Transcriptional regulator, MarR family [Streptomyces albus]AOU75812.1 Transcriptional regulator, MarR family [Streptomyces albus]AYN31616.1 MarR family transcriptional regulator [Streptomyces albus]